MGDAEGRHKRFHNRDVTIAVYVYPHVSDGGRLRLLGIEWVGNINLFVPILKGPVGWSRSVRRGKFYIVFDVYATTKILISAVEVSLLDVAFIQDF